MAGVYDNGVYRYGIRRGGIRIIPRFFSSWPDRKSFTSTVAFTSDSKCFATFVGMAEEYRSVLPPYHLISACSHFIWRCFSRPAGLGPGRARGTGGN